MDLQYLAILSYAFNPALPLINRKRAVLISQTLALCLLGIIFISINRGFINPQETHANTYLTEISVNHTAGYWSSCPMNNELWQYLRRGLNYLEASGKNYSPDFVHPGGVAYGPLALTRIAVLDVIQNYQALSEFTPEDVFSNPQIYEEFARSYAGLLLGHYLGMDYANMSAEQIFNVLQRAWFLGPGLYKKGLSTLPSREKRAQEYVAKIDKSYQ
jgi:hypothetical protein